MNRYEFRSEYDCECGYEQECKYEFVSKLDSLKLTSLENLFF